MVGAWVAPRGRPRKAEPRNDGSSDGDKSRFLEILNRGEAGQWCTQEYHTPYMR